MTRRKRLLRGSTEKPAAGSTRKDHICSGDFPALAASHQSSRRPPWRQRTTVQLYSETKAAPYRPQPLTIYSKVPSPQALSTGCIQRKKTRKAKSCLAATFPGIEPDSSAVCLFQRTPEFDRFHHDDCCRLSLSGSWQPPQKQPPIVMPPVQG